MAVISVTKAFGDESTQDVNGKVIREHYLVQIAPTDTVALGYNAVDPNTAVTVPDYGDEQADDPTLTVTNISVARWPDIFSPQLKVSLDYKGNSLEKPNNTKWNKRVSSAGSELIEKVNQDTDGNPIRNAVGDLYQADFEIVKYDQIITASFNTRDVDVIESLDRSRGLVNDADVTLNINRFGLIYTRTFPAGTLKLGDATWSINLASDGLGCFEVDCPMIYRFQRDSDGNEVGWQFQIPDRGERYIPASGGDPVKSQIGIVDLAENGTRLDDGDPQHLLVKTMIGDCDFTAFLDGLLT